MDELKKALILKKRYDNLHFVVFVKELEKYIGKKIPKKKKDSFKYTGLSNTDFFLMYVE